jgi:hypothetical protein
VAYGEEREGKVKGRGAVIGTPLRRALDSPADPRAARVWTPSSGPALRWADR